MKHILRFNTVPNLSPFHTQQHIINREDDDA